MRQKTALITALLLLLLQVTGCSSYDASAFTVSPSPNPPLSVQDGYVYIANECCSYVDSYMAARQVPMGKIVLSNRLLAAWESFDGETRFPLGVCYAAMQPKHVPLPGDSANNDEILCDAATRAIKCLEKQGIEMRWIYNEYDYFQITATKDQILNLTCDPDVALYIFASSLQ